MFQVRTPLSIYFSSYLLLFVIFGWHNFILSVKCCYLAETGFHCYCFIREVVLWSRNRFSLNVDLPTVSSCRRDLPTMLPGRFIYLDLSYLYIFVFEITTKIRFWILLFWVIFSEPFFLHLLYIFFKYKDINIGIPKYYWYWLINWVSEWVVYLIFGLFIDWSNT